MFELFYPKRVAVIGVSESPNNLGRNIVGNLVEYGFQGVVYAVGPRGGVIETRCIYPTIQDVPDEVDLVVIITPAPTVPGILEQCGQKGIRWAIIQTAGFREYGDEGHEIEREIDRVAEKYGIRFLGPNCIGVINMENGLCVPFPRLRKFLKRGDVSVLSQSGGVGMSVLNLMSNEGLGLNKFASVGNMQNLDAEDMLEYMVADENTRLIFVYLESMRNGRRLMEIAKRSPKPILVFKSNIGALGRKIAMSHTASLTSDDKVVEAAFRQAGILRVGDATSLRNGLKVLEMPLMKGPNLAVISRSGGHAVIAADACELVGFNLAHFPDPFLREIEKHFRASVIRLTNPLDLGDLFDLDVYAQIVEQTLQLDGVDGVVFLHTAISEAENMKSRALLERLMSLVEKYQKPVAYYISASAQEVVYLKQNYHFPIFTEVVETVRGLDLSYEHYRHEQHAAGREEIPQFLVNRAAVKALVGAAAAEGRDLLLHEALVVLEHYGVQTVRSVMASTVAEAKQAAEEMGYPVVVKVVAGKISHKTDVGGVLLNLPDGPALEAACAAMLERIRLASPDAQVDGLLVQPMAAEGVEVILGGRQDASFGPVVLFGLGGILVEVLKESVVRVAPISPREAVDMIESLRGAQILRGVRGRSPADIEALTEALLRLSQLLTDFPQIKEIDINPLRVFSAGKGYAALDARIILSDQ
ncbi:MAG: acetate--CoA ligase family protein [Anaerolineales bacterium]|nr:acetate--CoA ligase family protein [Anaerolineales bacterium]